MSNCLRLSMRKIIDFFRNREHGVLWSSFSTKSLIHHALYGVVCTEATPACTLFFYFRKGLCRPMAQTDNNFLKLLIHMNQKQKKSIFNIVLKPEENFLQRTLKFFQSTSISNQNFQSTSTLNQNLHNFNVLVLWNYVNYRG